MRRHVHRNKPGQRRLLSDDAASNATCTDAANTEIKQRSHGLISSCKEAKVGGQCSIADISKTCGLSCGTCNSYNLPAWATCTDSSEEILIGLALKFGRISPGGTYSCVHAKVDGACALAIAADICPVTCSLCLTPDPSTSLFFESKVLIAFIRLRI